MKQMKGKTMKKFILPTICIDEVKFCDKGKFFYAKYKDSGSTHIVAKFDYEELLYNLEKQGFDIVNKEGSLI
jgi:hypothetical protein